MEDEAEALKARARARIGQVLSEKWRLDKLLGVGGMAVVYAATHVNNGRRAAIKLLHAELSMTPEVRTRFLREGYAANKVEHPGTVAVLDDQVAEDGSVFLVMELLEGETLEDRRERVGSLPPHEVLSLTDRLLDVLAVAHDKGVVHRDIKPENVFLTREGTVKVLDFGIARMRELQAARLTMTAAGAIGTPAFMPPEQARGRWDDVGPRSDIWAVGATMFTLVSGRLVHNAETVNELMLAAMTRPAPPVSSVVPNLPPQVAAIIDRALAYDQNARWPDARSMQAALRAAYQSFDRPSMVGMAPFSAPAVAMGPAPALISYGGAPSGSFSAVPSGAYPAAPASAPFGAGPPSAVGPMSVPGGATGHPVTMIGAGAAKKSGFPVLPLVGGLAGAVVLGGIVLAVVASRPSPAPAASADAASASAAPSAVPAASDTPTASASAMASAVPSASASAAPADSATPASTGKYPGHRPGWIHKKPK
jgi:eukaryotic-like serine/threonine-protein kinase